MNHKAKDHPAASELGRKSEYHAHYNPDKLFPIARQSKRQEIGIDDGKLPFYGYDRWTHYEVSWLNMKGKPMVAIADIHYPCTSPNIIESKSMKLYFNSLNQSQFENEQALQKTLAKDLSERVGAEVFVKLILLQDAKNQTLQAHLQGQCLDTLDVSCKQYQPAPELLTTTNDVVEETVHSNLLKSNCLVTFQPDWGSIQIHYRGRKINHEGLLKYIVSFREHNEFHEQCIERIFHDITEQCQPDFLTVHGRYTRRGGCDINPFRSSEPCAPTSSPQRLCRQ